MSVPPVPSREPPARAAPAGVILLVEDDACLRRPLSAALEHRGYTVYTAADGQKAVRVAQEVHPDVILTDLGLPDVDGLETARAIRLYPELEHVPIVSMTAWNGAEARARVCEDGLASPLTKPFDVQDLAERVVHRLDAVLIRPASPPSPADPPSERVLGPQGIGR